MKKLLMLKPRECGSMDTTKGQIYEITEDIISVLVDGDEDREYYDYTIENIQKYPDHNRWITINDNSSTDSFEVFEDEYRFVIFENDNELAHELINRIEGLDIAIVNMASSFMKK